MATFGVNIAFWLFFGCILGAAMALQCYKCGMYNDGVGSITPCINDTNMPLLVCPDKDHKYCIKYQSEGSTVRDCVAACTEREYAFDLRFLVNSYPSRTIEIDSYSYIADQNRVDKIYCIVTKALKTSRVRLKSRPLCQLAPIFLNLFVLRL
ncbi:hypothetical protein WA026_017203 [Henosepilachna vigintioctopunctata]|uniref:Uncharacterized protein n=1 Tax=Henosepilachna vigintioctopunctata TaxID=420089 RepID=A0AAW1UPA9_9CUCU